MISYSSNISLSTYSKVLLFVAFKSSNDAFPALYASLHLNAQRHHLSPYFKPGKPPLGVVKSFPCELVYSKNSSVTSAHTV